MSKFDPCKPWDSVFLMAAEDKGFWYEQVAEKATQFVNHMNKDELVDDGHHAWLPDGRPRSVSAAGGPRDDSAKRAAANAPFLGVSRKAIRKARQRVAASPWRFGAWQRLGSLVRPAVECVGAQARQNQGQR